MPYMSITIMEIYVKNLFAQTYLDFAEQFLAKQ